MARQGINYRKLPEGGGNPRQVAYAVNLAMDGKLNCKGSVTLAASATQTVVKDYRAGVGSTVLLTPRTANAASAASALYVLEITQNGFTLGHASSANTDQTFDYVVLG